MYIQSIVNILGLRWVSNICCRVSRIFFDVFVPWCFMLEPEYYALLRYILFKIKIIGIWSEFCNKSAADLFKIIIY